MMIDSHSGEILDDHLGGLRREWVAAYWAWTQLADDNALTRGHLNVQQRSAFRRYRAAETAYFMRLRMMTDAVSNATTRFDVGDAPGGRDRILGDDLGAAPA